MHAAALCTVLTVKQQIPLLLAKSASSCWMYPAARITLSNHLAISGFHQSDHTVSKLTADADSLRNTVKQVSRPQDLLKTQPLICLDYRARNRPQLK